MKKSYTGLHRVQMVTGYEGLQGYKAQKVTGYEGLQGYKRLRVTKGYKVKMVTSNTVLLCVPFFS